jgi:DinB superfamily
MKSIGVIALVAFAAPMFAADNGKLTDTERTYLVGQLEQTEKDVIASLQGLSDAQWKYKAGADRWSVQQCAEHIILAEGLFFNTTQQMLKSPAIDRMGTSKPDVDSKMTTGVEDRSHKFQAPPELVPSGKFATPAEAIAAFRQAREKSIAYVKTTNDDLRTHVGKGPAGDMDAYQFLVLMSGHSERHTKQIKEVEADPNYPKS